MGCTSSAPNPNMSPNTKLNAKDNAEEFSDEHKDQEMTNVDVHENIDDENRKNKVLPLCDTLGKPIILDRNNKTVIDPPTADVDKVSDSDTNGHVVDGDNKMTENVDLQVEEKLSSLGEVVEKIVELYVADTTENTHTEDTKKDKEEKKESTDKNDTEVSMAPDGTPDEVIKSESQEPKEVKVEAISPSQSTSSRATRWEALADVAAELPPSHAVDPVTGQIYALAK